MSRPSPRPAARWAWLALTVLPIAWGCATRDARPSAGGFERALALNGVQFRVTSPNASSINVVRIAAAGPEIDDRPISREVNGTVTGAEVGDLDGDGMPEIYVFVTSAGSGSYGSLAAWAIRRGGPPGEIRLPPPERGAKAYEGYQGHDRFELAGRSLLRRFPVYRAGDANARPTGGSRELRYRLEPGEGGGTLVLQAATDRR